MTYTQTQTKTFTITEARYIASKIATDLNLMNTYYGKPSVESAAKYAEEAALYIAKRYLDSVEYGYEKNGTVVFSLKYTAKSDGTLNIDDRPGKIPLGLNMEGVTFYTYLRRANSFWLISDTERDSFLASLPFQRTSGGEPILNGNGYWEKTQSYSKNGEGVERQIFKQIG